MLLAFGAYVGLAERSKELDGTFSVYGGWIAFACVVALIFVVTRCYPVVQFGPKVIRWRNWFRWKEVPTASVGSLGVEHYSGNGWVPVIVADLDRERAGRRSARFVATFSYRRKAASTIASEVSNWANDRSIPCELRPDVMTWRFKDPR